MFADIDWNYFMALFHRFNAESAQRRLRHLYKRKAKVSLLFVLSKFYSQKINT